MNFEEQVEYLLQRFRNAKKYFQFILGDSKTITAGATQEEVTLSISNAAGFHIEWLVGLYTTFQGGADDGVCRLAMSIQDSGIETGLTNKALNLALLFSPGRQRTSGIAGDPSNPLFYGRAFDHVILPNTDLNLVINSTSDESNEFSVAFFGHKLKAKNIPTPGDL